MLTDHPVHASNSCLHQLPITITISIKHPVRQKMVAGLAMLPSATSDKGHLMALGVSTRVGARAERSANCDNGSRCQSMPAIA